MGDKDKNIVRIIYKKSNKKWM